MIVVVAHSPPQLELRELQGVVRAVIIGELAVKTSGDPKPLYVENSGLADRHKGLLHLYSFRSAGFRSIACTLRLVSSAACMLEWVRDEV